jgi:hypothetical protein
LLGVVRQLLCLLRWYQQLRYSSTNTDKFSLVYFSKIEEITFEFLFLGAATGSGTYMLHAGVLTDKLIFSSPEGVFTYGFE